jgi:hypothetical protein
MLPVSVGHVASPTCGPMPAPMAPPAIAGEGATGGAGAYSATDGGLSPSANGLPFGTRAGGVLCPVPFFGFPLWAGSDPVTAASALSH